MPGKAATPPLVLAINHDSLLLEVMRELLNEEGYRCTTYLAATEDPARVIAEIRAVTPALVILDVPAPTAEEAWQVLDAVKLHPDTGPIPLVVTTTDNRGLREREAKLRALNVLSVLKPFALAELLAAIQQALGTKLPTE